MIKRMVPLVFMLAFLVGLMPMSASADVLKEALPDIDSKNYVVIDADTGEILFGKKYDADFDPDTFTQMMTALLILEHGNLSEKVTAPEMPGAINSGNTVYIRKNEEFTLEDLLKAIVIYNANDAAYAAAHHLGGSIDGFVEKMNQKAAALGMDHTVFKSPYRSAKGQKTTAADMAKLAAAVSAKEDYVSLTKKSTLNWNGEMFAQDNLPNANGFSVVMKDGIGVKFSNEKNEKDVAMHLAASVQKDGRHIVGIIANESNEASLYDSMKTILDFGLTNTKMSRVLNKNTTLASVEFDKKRILNVQSKNNYMVTVPSQTTVDINTRLKLNKVSLPINAGDEVGTMDILNGNTLIKSIPVYAQNDVAKKRNVWVGIAILLAVLYLLTILLRASHQIQRMVRSKKNELVKALPGQSSKEHQPAPIVRSGHPKRVPAANERRARGRRDNPSAGSSEGRKSLDERVMEKKRRQRTYTIHKEEPGDNR